MSLHTLHPRTRRVLQALLYEGIAVAVVTPALALIFDKNPVSTFFLSVVLSTIALVWNYLWNSIFEWWEARQRHGGRSARRRFAHGFGFEGGLTIIPVPIMAYWLRISYVEAFVTNLGFLVFFFCYTIVFTWGFDRIFGLPRSALREGRGQPQES
ncbi:MAG: PACE efflux transporter [Gammaproteobacteria bacterium]|nr:PACE efflux transporter [Gammaproteobacteria bacterium]